MPKVRILVVDDSVVFRRLVSDELSRDPELEVVATAADGRIALAKLTRVSPDLIVLDVVMPVMDGLATLKEIRKTHPRLPVIMFSALTERGAEATLDALALGASDYFAKPSDAGGLEGSLRVIRDELVPRIKALCTRPSSRPAPAAGRRSYSSTEPVRVVAIGASTGGPKALTEIFANLPADFPVPILVVQHMPPMFTHLLAERLSAQSLIVVREASPGCILKPGEAWIAPGDYHMIAVKDGLHCRLQTHQDPPENSCRPAVDVLLRSVAKVFGAGSLTAILTGMGRDGLRGCELVREAGGQILAQDEATSVVWGMPGYVVQAGLADRVLPLSMIASAIVERVRLARRPT
ncbi:MAG: chemotaxis response regulator protein-glutamate methylesterase [Isosphaeraceae bacterium]